jgi:hypothetical protein
VTSPPYWGLRDYGVEGQIGAEPSLDAYVGTLVGVVREVSRVLTDDGVLWLNLGDGCTSGGRSTRARSQEWRQGHGDARAYAAWTQAQRPVGTAVARCACPAGRRVVPAIGRRMEQTQLPTRVGARSADARPRVFVYDDQIRALSIQQRCHEGTHCRRHKDTQLPHGVEYSHCALPRFASCCLSA